MFTFIFIHFSKAQKNNAFSRPFKKMSVIDSLEEILSENVKYSYPYTIYTFPLYTCGDYVKEPNFSVD